MERVGGIGGVFFRSPRPGELRRWYAEHLGLDVEEDWGGAVLTSSDGDTLTWAIFDADTGYFGPSGQQLMVNYRVRDLDAMLAQLRAAGAPVDDARHESENGRFGWATDLDGNRIELWEPAPGQ